MNFIFEKPSATRGRARNDFYAATLTSTRHGETKRAFEIKINPVVGRFIIEAVGDRFAIAFDNERKIIAIKKDGDGWKLSQKKNKKGEIMSFETKIIRTDMWSKIKNIHLTTASISVIDDMVIFNVGAMK